LHQIAHVGVSESTGLKLFGRDHGTWSLQTDRQTTYNLIAVLCIASRGKMAYLILLLLLYILFN